MPSDRQLTGVYRCEGRLEPLAQTKMAVEAAPVRKVAFSTLPELQHLGQRQRERQDLGALRRRVDARTDTQGEVWVDERCGWRNRRSRIRRQRQVDLCRPVPHPLISACGVGRAGL